ncbi:MAG: transposase, partial [Bacteroidota bacterium]
MSTRSSQRIRNRRRYSAAFKQARVDDFERGTFSVGQICRLYDLPMTTVYRWINKYSRYPVKA